MSREDCYIEQVFKRVESDSGFRAIMKHADNEAFEWKAWAFLKDYVYPLSDCNLRKAYAIVGAAAAKSHQNQNGNIGLGKAIALTLKDSSENEKVYPPRLMKILSVDDPSDLLDIMRTTFSYFQGKGIKLDFSSILGDLVGFVQSEERRESIKVHWVLDFLPKDGSDNVSE